MSGDPQPRLLTPAERERLEIRRQHTLELLAMMERVLPVLAATLAAYPGGDSDVR
jgi:hypothetical protein